MIASLRARLSAILVITTMALVIGCHDSTGAGGRPAFLVVDPDSVDLFLFDSLQLSASVLDEDSALISGASVTFLSTDTSIAKVSSLGVIHSGGTPGRATIVVTADTLHKTVPVNVKPIVARISLADAPYGVAASDAGVVYVAPILGPAVRRIDMTTFTLTDAITVGGNPTQVAFVGAGGTAVVTKRASGSIGVIDVATHAQIDTIAIPGSPYPIRVTGNGTTAYVTSNAGWLYKVDIASRTRIDSLAMSDPSLQLALGPGDSLLYVASQFLGSVTEVRTATMVVKRTFMTGGTPQGVAVSQNGAELYVSDEGGPLRIWSLSSATEIDTVSTGGGTFGVALTPDGTKLFVGTTAGVIFKIDRASHGILSRLDVGGTPRNIAVDPVTGYAVVPNEAGGWIDIVK
jgi:DNA-binding beta-propeller fold protein YncE